MIYVNNTYWYNTYCMCRVIPATGFKFISNSNDYQVFIFISVSLFWGSNLNIPSTFTRLFTWEVQMLTFFSFQVSESIEQQLITWLVLKCILVNEITEYSMWRYNLRPKSVFIQCWKLNVWLLILHWKYQHHS